MDSGTESEVVERLFGFGSGLILFELSRLDNHTLRPFSTHRAYIENKIETVRIVPVRAEHRHEAPAACLIDLFNIIACRRIGQTLPRPDLFNPKFDGRGQKHFQHMPDPGQKLMTQVAVVNHLAVISQFAERSLEGDPVGPQILQQALPPVRALFDDLVEFGFGDTIAPARFHEHLSPDAMVAKTLGHSFSQFLTFARSALINCDDRHDTNSLAFVQLSIAAKTDSATKGSAGRLTVGVPLRTRRAEALAFLRRLIHLLGGDQYRSFDTGLAGPVPRKRDGRGACVIGEIYYRENIGITESKIQRLQFASGRFEELLSCLPPLGAAVFCHTFRAVLRQRNLHKKFRHINLLVMEPLLNSYSSLRRRTASSGLDIAGQPVARERSSPHWFLA